MLHHVYIPDDISPAPSEHEVSAAILLSKHFRQNVILQRRNSTAKTADYLIAGQVWELKSPLGNSKRTMQNNLRKAGSQSGNVIIDLRRSKMRLESAKQRINYELARANKIKRLLMITKTGKILVIK